MKISNKNHLHQVHISVNLLAQKFHHYLELRYAKKSLFHFEMIPPLAHGTYFQSCAWITLVPSFFRRQTFYVNTITRQILDNNNKS